MELIVINKGIVQEKSFQQKFVFRQMLDMPIGLSYLYLQDKTPEVVEMEMRVLNTGDRTAPVYFKSINKAFPIFWEDEMPEIPVACFNIFELIEKGEFELLEVDGEFWESHEELFNIYKKYAK